MATPSSGLINKAFRKHITPVLKESGFETVNVRKNYLRSAHAICLLEIRALGARLGFESGFPSSSVCVWLGVYYPFLPVDERDKIWMRIKTDKRGMLVPEEVQCHLRSQLVAPASNPKQRALWNPAERERRDIFWLERDGSDADSVSHVIADLITQVALPWFKTRAEPLDAIRVIETEDYPTNTINNKEFLCTHLALAAGRDDLAKQFIQDAARKGFKIRMK